MSTLGDTERPRILVLSTDCQCQLQDELRAHSMLQSACHAPLATRNTDPAQSSWLLAFIETFRGIRIPHPAENHTVAHQYTALRHDGRSNRCRTGIVVVPIIGYGPASAVLVGSLYDPGISSPDAIWEY